VKRVTVNGDRSTWEVVIDGKNVRWEAETAKLIPNEEIGWKSLSGPKHSGRLTFSPIGNDTLVHITMNYVLPLVPLGILEHPVEHRIASAANAVLREFKAVLEGRSARHPEQSGRHARTGTDPATAPWRAPTKDTSIAEATKEGQKTVEFNRPPDARYP
jgi:uncharacterized membrane protein